MVSSPSAYRSSPSGEKKGNSSRCSLGNRASAQSALSPAATLAIVSQRSAVEVCNRLHRPLDLLVAVRSRDKQSLELRGREVDPALEQVAEERAVAIGVRRLGVGEIPYRSLAHEQRRHRADPLHPAERRQARFEPGPALLELLVDVRLAQTLQHRERGSGRERVSAQRAGLVHLAARGELLHYIAAA